MNLKHRDLCMVLLEEKLNEQITRLFGLYCLYHLNILTPVHSIILLTILVPAKVRFCFKAWPRLSGFVNSNNTKLVPFSFTETRNSCFQFINNSTTVGIICHKSIKPATKSVFFLNNVMCDGSATIICGPVPS